MPLTCRDMHLSSTLSQLIWPSIDHYDLERLPSMARILSVDEFLEAFSVDSHPLDLHMGNASVPWQKSWKWRLHIIRKENCMSEWPSLWRIQNCLRC